MSQILTGANALVGALVLLRLRWLVQRIGWRGIVREVTRR